MNESGDEALLFSRSVHSGGTKCTTRIDVPVPEELADAIGALAFMRGQTKSEYARDLFARHVYGEVAHVQMIAHGKQHGSGNKSG